MFTREIERLTKELSNRIEMPLTHSEQRMCPGCSGESFSNNTIDLQDEIFSLKDEISHLKKQVDI
jgi:RNA polymerase subunit RPABC4/transcription elongation factor Spt4